MIVNRTHQIIKENNVFAKKKFGQNFLVSEHVLEKTILSSGITCESLVIEIGTGLGTLTEYLAASAKHVLTYEIDEEVLSIAKDNLSTYSNITFRHIDFLEVDIDTEVKDYLEDAKEITVIANIPYYITTPIAFKLLECKRISKIYLMMQEDLAERFCALPKTKEYNALSATISFVGNAKKLFSVSRNCFYPIPGVDSMILEIVCIDKGFNVKDEDKFFRFIRNLFAQKRKTVVNNLVSSTNMTKDKVLDVLKKCNYKDTIRAEEMSIENIVKLYKTFVGENDESIC